MELPRFDGSPGATQGRAPHSVRALPASLSEILFASQAEFQKNMKQLLAVRWLHWINFPLLTLMIWSGLLIYWANSVYSIKIFGGEKPREAKRHHARRASIPNQQTT